MRIEIVAVDKLRAAWAREGVAEYLERIGRYAPVTRREVKAARGHDEAAVADEGERILRAVALGPRDRLIALSPTGEARSSEEWARLLDDRAAAGVARVVFAIGGAGGLAPAVLSAADQRLSLGPQTLSHELAQLVLAEQIYRALTILRGEPYHK